MTIESFGSVEEMLAALEDNSAAADKSVQPWQGTLKSGDYFVRVGPGNVAIYCEVLDPSVPQDAGPHSEEYLAELKSSAEWYQEPHMRNFRFCRAFSMYCPRGEMGDVHISTASLQISKEHFEEARRNQWQPGYRR